VVNMPPRKAILDAIILGSGTGGSEAPKRGANEWGYHLLREPLAIPTKDWAGWR
jgi:hypothetical protein